MYFMLGLNSSGMRESVDGYLVFQHILTCPHVSVDVAAIVVVGPWGQGCQAVMERPLAPVPFVSHAMLGLRLTSSEGSAPRDVSCNPVGGKMTDVIITRNILAVLVLTR